jgi:hypothetical protein
MAARCIMIDKWNEYYTDPYSPAYTIPSLIHDQDQLKEIIPIRPVLASLILFHHEIHLRIHHVPKVRDARVCVTHNNSRPTMIETCRSCH